MAGKGFHMAIMWFVVIVLALSVIFKAAWFNYAVAIALIYLVLRTPLKYAK